MDIDAIADLSLAECLELVQRRFDLRTIAARSIDDGAIAEYYRQSDRGYRLFHSAEGAIHLALNENGQFAVDGYAGQARIVGRHLDAIAAQRVLEAGCGNGFNLVQLAPPRPKCHFVGVDLTDGHVAAARRATRAIGNVAIQPGNYLALPYPDASFDAVYAIEAYCQAGDPRRALAEAHRVLRPGGRLIVVDCFGEKPLDGCSDDLKLATRLVEKTTAVNEFWNIHAFRQWAQEANLVELEAIDLREAVAHNLVRLYGLARRFFNMSAGVWAMEKAFGEMLLENAICGLMMPFTVTAGVHGYYALAWQRQADGE